MIKMIHLSQPEWPTVHIKVVFNYTNALQCSRLTNVAAANAANADDDAQKRLKTLMSRGRKKYSFPNN